MTSPNRFTQLVFMMTLCGAFLGCTEENPRFIDPADNSPCDEGELVIEPFNTADPFMVDILFVVDNSPGSMAMQQALSAAMPRFVQQLNSVEELDYQLGIVSTDILNPSHRGALQTGVAGQAGCPGDRPAVITPSTQAGPTVAGCNALLGENGDGFASGLEAVRYATHGPAAEPGGLNEGFLRPDARFAVVVVSHVNDCSHDNNLDRSNPSNCEWDRDDLMAMSTYVGETNSYFDAVKAQHAGQSVEFVAIVGPDDGLVYERPESPQPVCAANGSAFNGRRYVQVTDVLGDRGGFFNVCAQRYESTLQDVIEEHILPSPDVICPFLNLTQEPVSVRLVDVNDANVVRPLQRDQSGYLYLGPTESCANGAIEIAPTGLGVLGAGERVEVHYCTDEPPQ